MDFISKEMLDNDGKGQDELQIAYRTFCGGEENGSGITYQLLKDTIRAYGEKRISDDEIKWLFDETDYDNDGYINFDDFIRMMMT